jgi:hypothetical protein
MIALILPKWLNSKTEEAFPSQSTVAAELSMTTRAVNSGFAALVAKGHLSKCPGKRGFHGTNIYKMELWGNEMVNENSSSQLATETMTNRPSLPVRKIASKDGERSFVQTNERTKKEQVI